VDGDEIRTAALWSSDVPALEWHDKGGSFSRFSDKGRNVTVGVSDSDPDGETDDLLVLEKQ